MSFIAELKRRNVFRVGIAYLVVAWLILQVSDVILGNIEAPGWVFRVIMLMLSIGFPIILLFAWAFEMTPDGIKREKQVDPAETITAQTGQKLNGVIIGALILAVGYIAVDKFVLSGEDPAVIDGGVAVSADTLSAETAAAARSTNSIAVLPFTNRSANNENAEFFALGIQDELLTLLSQLGNLKVISRTSVERLDPNLTIPKIGALLGVATILEGQVQRAGDKVRINVQLIDTQKEGHLWASIYDRDLTAGNIFEIQSDIAKAITDALHIQLSANDEAVIRAVPTENTEAMNQYMLGQYQLSRGSFEGYDKATSYFKHAIELDPNYAQAWIGIGETASMMLQTGSIDFTEYRQIAERAAATAMRLNDRLPAAHAQLALLRWRSGDAIGAEAAFQKALQLNPRDTGSLLIYGRHLRSTDRPQQAIPILLKARETDPLSPEVLFELGKAEMYSGNAEKAVAYAEQILALNPTLTNGRALLFQAHLALGRYDLSFPEQIEATNTDPADFENWAHLAAKAEDLGESSWADRYIERALVVGPGKPAVLKCQAMILANRGQTQQALAIARKALAEKIDSRWGSDDVFLRLVRDDALRTGNYEDALVLYRDRVPELFQAAPIVDIDNVNASADIALLLQHAGRQAEADTLLDTSLAWVRKTTPAVVHGTLYTFVDVELLALKGDVEGALRALGEAVDGGWHMDWHWYAGGRNLDSIRDTAEFKRLSAKFEAKMATQLEAIRELPNLGAADLR